MKCASRNRGPICLLGVRQARDRAGFRRQVGRSPTCSHLVPNGFSARLPFSFRGLDSELRWNHDAVKPLSRQKAEGGGDEHVRFHDRHDGDGDHFRCADVGSGALSHARPPVQDIPRRDADSACPPPSAQG